MDGSELLLLLLLLVVVLPERLLLLLRLLLRLLVLLVLLVRLLVLLGRTGPRRVEAEARVVSARLLGTGWRLRALPEVSGQRSCVCESRVTPFLQTV